MATIINTKPPAPLWLRELASARTAYEERLGWPVTMEVSRRRLVLHVGPALGAITTTPTTGRRVLAELRAAGLAGPVLAPAGGRWTFLTGPSLHQQPVMPIALSAAGVHTVPRGKTVTLPSDLLAADWVAAPTHSLPPWSTVIRSARRVLR